MTSAWSQLEQMLTCAICLDKFKNPRLLPCQHSFCGDACMDGLVDYARRQIKCPECRAEHRIPYQGVQSLPLNVTLIRFLELHARITGEEPEPVPTFMEKCSICGEKVEGVQRCSHCEKKVCPECKEAHIDLLRREIGRLNGQTKRSLSKMEEFKEVLQKSEEKLATNHSSVRREIEESCKRLFEDLKLKQQKLLEEVDQFAEQEQKTIDKLKVAIGDEHEIISKNLEIGDEKIVPTTDSASGGKLSWLDNELSELKDIYNRSMEFSRMFDPEIGDFTRKIRFTLIPEFDTLRKRICELGELKFSETAAQLIANSFQYCNATGQVAQELCQQAAAQQKHHLERQQVGVYAGLAHSNSNTNLGGQMFGAQGGPTGGGVSLELPNTLMRSQSDHRLASQFQQRLKAQEMAAKSNGSNGAGGSGRYGSSRANVDYDSELRSRYAPPRGTKDYSSDLLRDWPRPSDGDNLDTGSSIQFKSAFMRRKEKERYGGSTGSAYGSALDDDDDLTSEASYSTSGRNVRFYDQQQQQQQQQSGQDAGLSLAAKLVKQFETPEVEKAPLSGVPKLLDSAHYHNRLQQMGARSKVERRELEEQGARDKDLVESARQAMSNVAAKAMQQRHLSEDEVEREKRKNKQRELLGRDEAVTETEPVTSTTSSQAPASGPTPTPTPATATATTTTTTTTSAVTEPGGSGASSPATPTTSAPLPGGRRSLYGQAVTERSKRQLTSALQESASYARRRSNLAASGATNSVSDPPTPSGPPSVEQQADQTAGTPPARTKRILRSGSRSLSKQSSMERQQSTDSGSGASTRRRRLTREDSLSGPQASTTQATGSSSESKNLHSGSGSGGASGQFRDDSPVARQPAGGHERRLAPGSGASKPAAQTPSTTDDEDEDDLQAGNTGTIRRRGLISRHSTGASSTSAASISTSTKPTSSAQRFNSSSVSQSQSLRTEEEEEEDETEDLDSGESQRQLGDQAATGRQREGGDRSQLDEEEDEGGERSAAESNGRNVGNRRSRELLPSSMNRLLDRSAQIRRDSQEQRSRGDSPQRTSNVRGGSEYATSGFYPPTSSSSSSGGNNRPSSSHTSAAAGSIGQRFGYQHRSIGSRQDSSAADQEAAESSSSIYTTASSKRRSSTEDSNEHLGTNRHQSGGSSSERTLVGGNTTESPASRYLSSSRRDSGESGGYQSRFLARSRTSAALSSGATSSSLRSPDDYQQHHRDRDDNNSDSTSARSYLSSRDRFLQSTSGISPASSSSTTTNRDRNTTAVSGFRSHSEYLRKKFERARRESSGNSTSSGGGSSSILSRSKSSHSFNYSASRSVSSPPPESEDDSMNSYLEESTIRRNSTYSNQTGYGRRPSLTTGSRRTSQAGSTTQGFDAGFAGDSIYSSKGKMLFKLGSRGSEPGHFTWPRGVAVGCGPLGQSEIVVADSSNHRVQIFDSNGRFVNEFGSYGSEAGEFDCLAGVAKSRLANSYIVSDRYNHRMQVFDMSGKYLRSFGEFGRDQGKFNLPWGVACDSRTGAIYVCDKENHRVQVFDIDGSYLNRFGSNGTQAGQLQHPHYIAVGLGRVVVTDTNNHRVQIFDLSGRMIKVIGHEGSSCGEFKFPRGVAMDETGHIIVGDSGNNRLQIFNSEGMFIKSIGTWGSAEGEFKGIEGVAVDPMSNNILVCDRENHRIQVF